LPPSHDGDGQQGGYPMTRLLPVALVLAAGAFAAPAFAQDAATMVCKDYSAMDNTGKMGMVAELESMNSQMSSDQTVSSDDISTMLNTECAKDPNKLLQDVMKDMKKM
jgi:hypothetical protein